MAEQPWRRFKCLNCGFVYDEELGWPDEGIAAGTRWDEVPDDWICPECGSEKRDFTMIDWE
jgi:rubredoxin